MSDTPSGHSHLVPSGNYSGQPPAPDPRSLTRTLRSPPRAPPQHPCPLSHAHALVSVHSCACALHADVPMSSQARVHTQTRAHKGTRVLVHTRRHTHVCTDIHTRTHAHPSHVYSHRHTHTHTQPRTREHPRAQHRALRPRVQCRPEGPTRPPFPLGCARSRSRGVGGGAQGHCSLGTDCLRALAPPGASG